MMSKDIVHIALMWPRQVLAELYIGHIGRKMEILQSVQMPMKLKLSNPLLSIEIWVGQGRYGA